MRDPQDIVIKPVISEKTMSMFEDNKYTFIVDKNANKVEIKKAVEELFNVSVDKVNTLKVRRKTRRRGRIEGTTAERKKAVVTLKPGENIELFEEM